MTLISTVWLSSFILCTTAVPFGQLAFQARSSPYKNSIQILFRENVYRYSHDWTVYFGPQGIAVDPCNIAPFSFVLQSPVQDASVYSVRPKKDIPFTPEAVWPGLPQLYEGVQCIIEGSGEDLPALKCGEVLAADFTKDPQYKEAVICPDGFQYFRGYYVEYTA